MSVRSLATRIGITAAGGALAVLATSGAALATDPDHEPAVGPDVSASQAETDWSEVSGQMREHDDSRFYNDGRHHRHYKGRVIARSGLLLRDAPTRSADVVRSEPYGAIVHIFCKTKGDNVDGNWRWYLLTDGTWAWGSARYIENIGPAPRWC
ncbi:SH3 domain-containing protein [Streptomyces sp. NA04227]|uniref:SH3 domain-containing protein n=1 Tax=Streptomyces sp. NA04227 TaxID=2742136 RepID=UPI001590BFEA|nr:SH3 domain-containing protein [Streptomyces sp. NA04227]QKW09097.1 SH3 domain-containing protein [Streptomyces sp. NA04227]